jgi:hypothetical protein
MKPRRHRPTAEEGRAALRDHLVGKARVARERYGPAIDARAVRRLLADAELVRYATEVVFDAGPLRPGEFAVPERSSGDGPRTYRLVVHPWFRDRPEVLPYLVAYHVPTINYGELATHEEAELFGATLLGLDVDAYYERLCTLVDGMPSSPQSERE